MNITDETVHETMFREKALRDFHLDARDYVPVFDFTRDIDEASYDDLGELNYKKARHKFRRLFGKYTAIFEAPDAPICDDYRAIGEMRKYFNSNKGAEFGYLKYRRTHYHAQMANFARLMVDRNMRMLANKLDFYEAVERRLQLLDMHELAAQYIDPLNILRRQKNRWAKEPVLCPSCGVVYRQGNKASHIKTKIHVLSSNLHIPA